MRFLWLLATACFLTACDYQEVKREIGYKGRARINPWLAAERFVAKYDREVRSLATWTPPELDDAVWFVPASIVSNQSFARRLEDWVDDGGHLVLMVEHADADTNDWSAHSAEPKLEPAFLSLLGRAGIHLNEPVSSKATVTASTIEFDGTTYQVEARSKCSVAIGDGEPVVFVSEKTGDGRISVLTDGRLFRNRWIDQKDHAALLDALVRVTDFEGSIGFLRGSRLSLWNLLAKHLWPVLIGLAVLTILWLWKNFSRFGPVESPDGVSILRGYEHHLEALGNFQWRLDKGAALLVPLRSKIFERGQQLVVRAGRQDEDFYQFVADRAEWPRERVIAALAGESPSNPAALTRCAADLQRLLRFLH